MDTGCSMTVIDSGYGLLNEDNQPWLQPVVPSLIEKSKCAAVLSLEVFLKVIVCCESFVVETACTSPLFDSEIRFKFGLIIT